MFPSLEHANQFLWSCISIAKSVIPCCLRKVCSFLVVLSIAWYSYRLMQRHEKRHSKLRRNRVSSLSLMDGSGRECYLLWNVACNCFFLPNATAIFSNYPFQPWIFQHCFYQYSLTFPDLGSWIIPLKNLVEVLIYYCYMLVLIDASKGPNPPCR